MNARTISKLRSTFLWLRLSWLFLFFLSLAYNVAKAIFQFEDPLPKWSLIIPGGSILGMFFTQILIVMVSSERGRVSIRKACPNEIPAIVNCLHRCSVEGTFVMFVIPQPGRPKEAAITVQFSFEGGEVGFDWLLDNGLGNEERGRFEELAKRRGWKFNQREGGGFHYLRVQGGDPAEIAGIGTEVITSLYQVDPSEQLEVETDSPNWRRESQTPQIG